MEWSLGSYTVEELFSATVPKSSAEVRRVRMLKVSGSRNSKVIRDDEKGDEMNGEVEEIRSNAHCAHATWGWLWDDRRLKLEPVCVTNWQGRETTKNEGSSMHDASCIGINYGHRFPKRFRSLHTLLGFSLCTSCDQFNCCRCTNLFNFWPVREFLVKIHTAKMVLWGIIFTLVVWQWHPWPLLLSVETRPLHFWNFGSNSAIVRWIESIKVAKWTFFVSLCASRMNLLLALYLTQLPSFDRVELLPFLIHCCLCIRAFHCLRQEWTCVPNCNGSWSYILCQQCGLRDLSVEMVPFVAL